MLGGAVAAAADGGSDAATSTPPPVDHRGVVSLAVRDVVRLANEARGRRHRLRASFLEVYNEQCNDLLAPERRNLKLYERAGGVLVSGLSEWDVQAEPGGLDALLRTAERQRHVGSTYSNERSSRSHLLCTVTVDSWAREEEEEDDDDDDDDDEGEGEEEEEFGKGTADREKRQRRRRRQHASAAIGASGGSAAVLTSTLQLVDLAGSEKRHTDSTSSRSSMQYAQQGHEGARINKSLLTLSTIIHRLAETSTAQATASALATGGRAPAPHHHLPFRDSKLTRLLQPCLGGTAHAVVLATIRQTAAHVDESLATLRFAVRARRVLNTPSTSDGAAASSALLSRLSAEIVELRKQLSAGARPPQANGGGAAASARMALSLPSSRLASPRKLGRGAEHSSSSSSRPPPPSSPVASHRRRHPLSHTAHGSPTRPAAFAGGAGGAGGSAPFSMACPSTSPPRRTDDTHHRRHAHHMAYDPLSAFELSDAFDRHGLPTSLAREGAPVGLLEALEQMAGFRRMLSQSAAQMRMREASNKQRQQQQQQQQQEAGQGAASRQRGAAAVVRLGAEEAWTAPSREASTSTSFSISSSPSAIEAEADADAAVVDALEGVLVETVSGCVECINLLVRDLEKAHRTARASAGRRAAGHSATRGEPAEATSGVWRGKENEVVAGGRDEGAQGAGQGRGKTTLLRSERARAVRQSRASVCGGLDALSHLLACSVEVPRPGPTM
jgi:centromeric protein E